LLDEWKESIIAPNYKKGDKTDCSNYRGISLLSITYESIYNILLSKLIPYAKDIIGYRQYGCLRNILCIRQTLEKKWEYNEAVLRLVINFKKACDSVMMGLLYNIFTEFGIPMKVL